MLVLSFLLSLSLSFSLTLTSTPQLAKILRECSKEDVSSLLKEGESIHLFKMNLTKVKKLSKARLLIILGSEPWERELIKIFKGKVINLKLKDSHFFLSPKRVKIVLKFLKNYIKINENCFKKLNKLDKIYKKLEGCKFYTYHRMLYYLVKDYGVYEVPLSFGHSEFSGIRPSSLKGAKFVVVSEISGEKALKAFRIRTHFIGIGFFKGLEENLRTLRRLCSFK